jgi:hypothetical protein
VSRFGDVAARSQDAAWILPFGSHLISCRF